MNTHGIKAVTVITGLSAHVLRVWEKRYSAVTPLRTETNRRVYTDDHIARLQCLCKLIENGYSIGQIAGLEDAKLEEMLGDVLSLSEQSRPAQRNEQIQMYVQQAVDAIRSYDQSYLESILDRASKELGYSGLLERVIIPLMHQVGEDWSSGMLTVAGEHAATTFIKGYLSQSARSFSVDEHAPVLVVTTPAGQLHELGAYIGACLAKKCGWKIIYLGPSLPAEDIAGVVTETKAEALLLSIVYPVDDPQLKPELLRLRKHLPEPFRILVGGKDMKNYQSTLDDIGAVKMTHLDQLRITLNEIRETRLLDTDQV